MRGHIRVRSGPTGTAYELRVFAGTDETGKKRYVVETLRGSRRDAEKRLAQLVAGVDTGRVTTEHRARLHELVDEWWATSTGHLSPHTRIGYRGMLDRYILPEFGKRWIHKLAPLEIERWYAKLMAGPPPLSPLTMPTS